ncbi:MAG: UvrB/UvrC motif-containing protein, partial [Muribaculaceae bacterium]|nr:UvrB/UvrC motif-containing protein [Muribaculaceae bacterium]
LVGLNTDTSDEKPKSVKQTGISSSASSRHITASNPYIQEFSTSVDIAADPVIPYMNAEELHRSINRLRLQMVEAAKAMDFLEAARLRDEVLKMEERLNNINQ